MPPNVMQGVKTLRTVPFNHMEFILVLKKVYYNKQCCIEFNYTKKKKKITIYTLLVNVVIYLNLIEKLNVGTFYFCFC